MGYCEALEAAGAKVKEYWETGDWQGTWFALLDDNTVVVGSYGSCSGCDAFQAEFDYSYQCNEHRYTYPALADCEACQEAEKEYNQKLADFGRSYLKADAATLDELIAEYERMNGNGWYWDGPAILEQLKKWKTSV